MASPCRNPVIIPAEYVVVDTPLPTFRIAALEPPREWMRYCQACDREVRFLADRVCVEGLLGECTGCGEESIAPFTRANSVPA